MNAYQEFSIIGSRPVRPDGLDKVTGRARYGADLNMQGQIYGHIVRSPHAHAIIESIDTSQALAMEGVLAVMTGADLPEPGDSVLGGGEGAIALKDLSPMVMSQGKVLFHSQAVAAVAATSPELAAQAAALIAVSYQVLRLFTDMHEALGADAPILHADRFPDGFPRGADQFGSAYQFRGRRTRRRLRARRCCHRANLLGADVSSRVYRAPRVRGPR